MDPGCFNIHEAGGGSSSGSVSSSSIVICSSNQDDVLSADDSKANMKIKTRSTGHKFKKVTKEDLAKYADNIYTKATKRQTGSAVKKFKGNLSFVMITTIGRL